jgi:diphosphomevalonate decarboxylase
MNERSATALAHPNIALIKYWGNLDAKLRIPLNDSISMTLGALETRTRVTFLPGLENDQFLLNGQAVDPTSAARLSAHLDHIRELAGSSMRARVTSESNFPASAGLASSAAGFAALTLAATAALGLDLEPRQLSRLARRGSGSAARSIFGGFVEWIAGESDETSYAQPIAPPDHWDLVDVIAMVSREPKAVGSTAGHSLASTSPLQRCRIQDAQRRVQACKHAIAARNFSQLAAIVEQDSNMMHAIMMTSTPPLLYWLPQTLAIMHSVVSWRQAGLRVCYTIDAGPNVHCITTAQDAPEILRRLQAMEGVRRVYASPPGGPARLVEP